MRKQRAALATDRVKTTIAIPRVLHRTARVWCLQEDRDFQDVVAEALAQFLRTKGVKGVDIK